MSEQTPTVRHESTPDTFRSVTVRRTGAGAFVATNARGVELHFGTGSDVFTPVELLLAAIAGCASIDIEHITGKRAEPTELVAVSSGDKVKEGATSLMRNLEVAFRAAFPEGADGDAAREVLPRAVEMSRDRLCTVSRTVAGGSPVAMHVDES